MKCKYKRRKMYVKYVEMLWKQHKHLTLDYDMMRLRDWYKWIFIVKRGGMGWWNYDK